MKGITHFSVGLAWAACFPAAVAAAADGNPLYFILGGVFGLLPDTLDFKFVRYFYRTDITVSPDPLDPDPEQIAGAVAQAVQWAVAGDRPVTLRLNTIRLGLDRWQRYQVFFDVTAGLVTVELGPVVDTGGNPLRSGVAAFSGRTGAARLAAPVRPSYLAETQVDIFDGPVLRFLPSCGDGVDVEFLPWHRAWTHSLVFAALFGLAGWAVWDWMAGAIVAGAYAAHTGVDQLGYMGSNLWAPFTKTRSRGLKLAHAGDALPNFCGVWGAGFVMVWRLAAHAKPGVWIDPLRWVLLGVVLPCGIFGLLERWRQLKATAAARPSASGTGRCNRGQAGIPGGQTRKRVV